MPKPKMAPEFQEIEIVFQKLPDEKVMNHPDSAGYEGPLCFLHFSVYARELRAIRERMMVRNHEFYTGNIEDAREVAEICERLRHRADLFPQDHFSLKVLCRIMEQASKDFRLAFASPEFFMDSNKKSLAKASLIEPFCKKIREFEEKLDTLSAGSKLVDLDFPDLSPN